MNTPAVKGQRLLANESVGGDSILTLFMGVNLNKEYFSSRCGAHAFYTPNTEGLTTLTDWKEAAKGGNDALLDWVGS